MRSILTLVLSSFFIGISLLGYNYYYPFAHTETCDHTHQGNHTHTHGDFCGFDTLMSTLSPQEQQLQHQLELQLADLMARGGFPTNNQRMVLTVPVVVHVVHNNGAGNIPNGQVFAGVQHLNDAFANLGVYNPATGVDVEIQFCLAQRDPNGNTTNGITNTVSPLTNLNHNLQDLALKNVIRWNPNDYINIYVVNNIQGNVAGYAYLPAAHGNSVDGIVLEATYMGTNTDNSKVLVHEMGHYMGLYHTFHGGGCTNNNCLLDGDQICDTPPDQTTSWIPCNTNINSCTTDEDDITAVNPFRPVVNGGLGDQPDQKENYMDYSDFVCYDRFTGNQRTRMRFFLQGTRVSLLTSLGCVPACTSPINIGFTASATTFPVGTNVNFTNTTIGGTNYNWLLNSTSFASTVNSNFLFTTVGSFYVILEASNGDPNCLVRDSIIVTVTCQVQSSFTLSNSTPPANDTVIVTNTSANATGYQWVVNGVNHSTTPNLSLSYPAGNYDVCLFAYNAQCTTVFCQTIYVSADSNSCASSFFQTLGSSTGNEVGKVIKAAPDGTLFVAGGKGDSSLIIKLSPDGVPIWERTFKLTTMPDETITDFIVDSDNNIVAVGFRQNSFGVQCFSFKYNYQTHTVLWSRIFTGPPASRFHSIVEKAAAGNYFIVGQTLNGAQGLGCDALLLEVDRNNGAQLQIHHYNLGSCETFLKAIVYNNELYLTGRYNNAGGGFAQMRTAITRMDFSGNEIWSRLYITNVSTPARLYGQDLLVHNDTIVAVDNGDYLGTSPSNVQMHLYKTNLNGQITWAKRYNVPSGHTERVERLVKVPGGYLVLGFYTPTGSSTRNIFLFKTNEQGNLIWSKEFGSTAEDLATDLLFFGGSIFFIGETRSFGTGAVKNILFGKLNTDGEALDSCNFANDLVMTETLVVNPYDGLHPLTRYARNDGFNPTIASSTITYLPSESYCTSSCNEICGNGIDDDGDGLTDCYDPDCCDYCNQDRDKIWYFGVNAGLDFTAGSPTILTNGQLNTLEGCATINSFDGNLLFYTDGVNIYDRSHSLMPNGTGLLGDPSATQSSIIVPHPSNATLYYVFTSPAINSGNGIRYSIVDMTLNGGLGDVTATKNVQILSNADEKLTAIKHCNNKDYWVVAHQNNSNIFHVWSIDNTGLNITSTTYPVGSIYNTNSAHGYLKASQDGDRLAAAVMMDATFELYDFDNSTGAVSNPITMTDPAWVRAYGVEFSPDGNLLYASSCTDPSLLMQFDLSSGNAATIKASGVIIDSDAQYYSYGALQLAPDGKIYVARRHHPGTGPWWILNPSTRLSAINNPNAQGPACTFVDTAIVLLPGTSTLGLPNFIPNYHYTYSATINGPTILCNLPDTTIYTVDITGGGACTSDSIAWEYNGNHTILSQSDSNFILNVTTSGIDTIIVHLFSECNSSSDTFITVNSTTPPLDLGPDTSVCENAIVFLNAGGGFDSYLWQDNSTDSTLTASESGLYWVEAISTCGDTLRDSIIISIDTVGLISINDTSLCIGDTLQIVLPNTNSYQWFPNQDISCTNCNNPFIYPTVPRTYTVVSTNGAGCFSVDSFSVVFDTCFYYNTIDTAVCFGNFFSYNGSNIPPNTVDTILFTASNGLDSFVIINVLGLDTFNISIDTTVCLGDSLAFAGQFLMPNTSTIFNLQTTDGCDSIITVNILGLDTAHTIIDTTICAGTILSYNGQNLTAGSSTNFTFQTSNGCDSIVTINISSFPITLTTNSLDASCNGLSDGQATVNASGGLGGFNYNWNSSAQITATATGLAAGLHCVTVTDSIGCSADTCIQVNEPAGIISAFDTTNISCFGADDGQLIVTLSGGVLPYTYLWSNGQTSNTSTGLDANIHHVTITDANGCSTTASAPISEPTGIQLAFTVDSVQCKNEATGQIQAQVSGGVFPYTYQWNNSQNTAIATGLNAGTYSLTVTDFNGCTISNNATVFEPLIVLTASIINQSNPLCNDACDGMIEVDAQGATPNYIYQWNNGQQTSIASGICAGVHTVTVTDANGCSLSVGSVLTEPTAIALNPQVLSNFNGSPITCPGANDGAVGVTAAGGSGGYSYIWSPIGQNTASINNLYEGTYCVTVTDVSGCQADTCITINDPIPLAATAQQVNILCKGDANGQILVNATAGTGTLGINGYEYKIVGPNQTGNLYTAINNWNNLAGGAYLIYVRDGNDCEIQVPIQITEPDSVLIDSVVVTDALCFGTATGQAMAYASGGGGGFTYLWSNGQTQNPATGLAMGLYSVTIADANGCDRVDVFNVGEPTELTGSITAANIPCIGGTTTATAVGAGGTPIALTSYLYNWSNGNTNATTINLSAGVHCVTITDNNACTEVVCVTITEPSTGVTATIFAQTAATCQGTATGTATAQGVGGTAGYTYLWQTAPAQATQTATGLAAGVFTVVVTDANGCTDQTNVTITEPSVLMATIMGTTNASCFNTGDGTATVAGSGGTPSYSYDWGNGQSGATATGLVAGTYSVTLTDANNCTTTAAFNITSPTAVNITQINTTNILCTGDATGTASLSVNGGTPTNGYTYNWSGTSQTTPVVSGLSAGQHTVTATDFNGCFDMDTFIINEPILALTGYLTSQVALCNGQGSGQLGAIMQGGTGPYAYVWNTSPIQSTVVADSLMAGNYTVTVTDINGCSMTLAGMVGEATLLEVQANVLQHVSCFGGSNGSASVPFATGGTPTYSYVWTDPAGQSGQVATGLSAGTVSVVVTDANGCSASSSVTIIEPSEISLTENITPVSCFGSNDGQINITSSNKTIIDYNWGSFSGNPISNLTAGSYPLTVTDASGCQKTFVYNITEPNPLDLDIQINNPVLCFGDNNGSAQAFAIGGTPNYTYLWSNNSTNAMASNLAAGTYTVTATDSKGCPIDTTIIIEEPPLLTLTGIPSHTLCAGDQTGSITALGTGGTLSSGLLQYSIDGNNWQGGNVFSGLTAGIYTLSVQDQNGCLIDTLLVVEDANPFFITGLTPDTTIEYLDSIQIFASLNDTVNVIYSWQQITGIQGLITNNSYQFMTAPAEEVTYLFTATNEFGCTVDSLVTIEVDKPRRANAPMAFTPNGDGINDFFFIQGGNKVQEVVIFRIYDRWGELLYEGYNLQINVPNQGWDGIYRGKPVTSGSYAWYADVLFRDGETIRIKGDVTLLR